MTWSKPCLAPGCAALVKDGSRCEAHRLDVDQRGEHDIAVANRLYGRRWKRIRAHVLRREPLCRHCRQSGRFVEAVDVDHILPLRAGGTHDRDNLQPLCRACHNRKTAADTKREFS